MARLAGPLIRITAMAAWPAPEATAKMVLSLATARPHLRGRPGETGGENGAMADPATLPRPANLLRQETSPYLLQHADNPVHWRPWGPAALAEAQATNRPILLSIGYAACHWCH